MGMDVKELHVFEFTVISNDPVEPEKKIYLEIDYSL